MKLPTPVVLQCDVARRFAKANFVLDSGGRNGGVTQAVDYLVEGGQLGDLVRLLINAERAPRLHIHGASVLKGILAWHDGHCRRTIAYTQLFE